MRYIAKYNFTISCRGLADVDSALTIKISTISAHVTIDYNKGFVL
jgi:hypothetical protein